MPSNNILDRQSPPSFRQVDSITIIQPQSHTCSNGVKLKVFKGGSEQVVKVEFLFPHAGYWNYKKRLISGILEKLLQEGTKSYPGAKLVETLDFHGAWMSGNSNADYLALSLYCLKKHFVTLLPVIYSVITESELKDSAVQRVLTSQKEKFKINLEKNDVLARRAFKNALYGKDHPYGRVPDLSDYDSLERHELLSHYQRLNTEQCVVLLSGKVDDNEVKAFQQVFGEDDWGKKHQTVALHFPKISNAGDKIFIPKKDSVQSAIRVGKICLNRNDKDFAKLKVLVTVFGGYFGSRLMKNIREDKGYTYGIGAGIFPMRESSYFFIATEVGSDVCSNALKEIYREMQRLREEKVSKEELELVKNYMIGSFLGSLENIFAHPHKYRNLWLNDLDYSFYDNYIQTIRDANAESLQDLAQEFLIEDNLKEVVVGVK